MEKIKKTVIWLLALLWLGVSTVQAATFEGHHLATRIDVVYRQDGKQTQLHYQQTDDIEAILNYLRLLEYAGMPADDPEQQAGSTYRLVIHLADGRQHIYHLHADRYLSRNFRPWIKVDSSFSFALLLQTLSE